MAQSFVNLLVKDNGFNATLKRAMSTFASLGNAANGAKGQFSKFADSISQVAQSQQMLNTALKGNPYGMLAQAATMAFTKIIEKATEATDAEKRAFEWQQQRAEMEQQAYEAIGKSTGELMAKYELLRVEWLNLSTDQQKNEWINKNKSAFQGLNLAVTDVTSAENVFVNNTSQVVAALKARAEAEAYAEMYKDQIKKNAMNKVNGKYNTQLITDPYYRPSEMEARLAGFTLANKHENFEYKMVDNADPRNPGKHREWTGRLSQLGMQRLNANRQLGAASLENADRMLADQWAAKMAQAQANANALQNNSLFGSTGGSGGGKGGRTGNQTATKELTEMQSNQQRINELTQEYINISDQSTDAVVARQEEIRKEISLLEARNNTLKLYSEQAQGKLLGGDANKTDLTTSGFRGFAAASIDVGAGLTPEALEAANAWVKAGNDSTKAWTAAASAVQGVGSALGNIEDPAAKIMSTIAMAIANVAMAYTETLAKDKTSKSNIWLFIATAAAAMTSMISTISSIHSATGYAQGGEIKGNSYSGDNIPIMANAGEIVLNKAQQATLASSIQQNGGGGSRVVGILKGEDIVLMADRWGMRTGRGELLFGKNL